jgi:hypothetical protein
MTTSLPAKFLFVRNCELQPYVSAAEMTAIQSEGGYAMSAYGHSPHQFQLPATIVPFSFFMTATIKKAEGGTVSKRIYKHPYPAKNATTGEQIPILTFASPNHVFGAYVLKLKIILNPSSNPGSVTPALSVTAPAVPVAPVAVLPPTPKPVKQKKNTAGDLNQFVAKQLLELAQSKHEMCPIVAEEFAAGHTAAMPCGHLFADFAIEETFKKEPNKCPVCRVYGHPTYV